jgi:hypothetical protein
VTPRDPDRSAEVRTAQGDTFAADLVVGADGARSTVRATVDPQHPDARYAGVLLWRTLVDERAMPRAVALPAAGEPAREVYAGPYRLVTYPVPGPGGETAVGHRRLNLVWYDPEQRELLYEAGLLDGQTVHGTLAPGALPGPVRQRLADFATARWPSPWREALTLALESGMVFGTPIVHYKPVRLVNGRAALAGDAAHAASPMVGGGFRQGLYDVLALAQAMTAAGSPAEVPAALARYQRAPGRGDPPRDPQQAGNRRLPGRRGSQDRPVNTAFLADIRKAMWAQAPGPAPPVASGTTPQSGLETARQPGLLTAPAGSDRHRWRVARRRLRGRLRRGARTCVRWVVFRPRGRRAPAGSPPGRPGRSRRRRASRLRCGGRRCRR